MNCRRLLTVCLLLVVTGGLIGGGLDARDATADPLGNQIAGTYYLSQAPDIDISAILQLSSDGLMTLSFSHMFRLGFTPHQGTWRQTDERQIQITVVSFNYDRSNDNTFLGIAGITWEFTFDEAFQTATGVDDGNVYAPGVDPFSPGDAVPIITFGGTTREFKRVP